jgi:hypothetical protein
MPLERKAALLAAAISLGDFSSGGRQGGLVCAFPNQALGAQTLTEAWYQAPPGCKIAKIGYRGKVTSFPAGWVQSLLTTDLRTAAGAAVVGTTLDDTLRTATITTPTRYVAHEAYSNGTAATPAAGASVQLSKLAAYGNHGITTHAGDALEPDGLYLSDILKNIAQRFCPMLDTSGVQTNNYVVQHCAYRDPTSRTTRSSTSTSTRCGISACGTTGSSSTGRTT